jgi:hypothetical protein
MLRKLCFMQACDLLIFQSLSKECVQKGLCDIIDAFMMSLLPVYSCMLATASCHVMHTGPVPAERCGQYSILLVSDQQHGPN